MSGARPAVVDAQVHIWGANSPERPWVAEGRTHHDVPLGADELLADMDAAGVDAAILVPPSFEGYRNDLVLAAAAAHPNRFGVMGRIALDDPAGSEPIVRGWRAQPGALGFRLVLSSGSDINHPSGGSWLIDGSAEWFWPVAEASQVPVMVQCIDLLDEIGDVADRFPALRLVTDHLGLPTAARDAEVGARIDDLAPWRPGRTSRSRRDHCRATPRRPIRIRTCKATCGESSTCSARAESSGRAMSAGCRAATGRWCGSSRPNRRTWTTPTASMSSVRACKWLDWKRPEV